MPQVIVAGKLTSYSIAHREMLTSIEHRRSKHLNNRGRGLRPTDQAARTGDETVHITRAHTTVPVRVRFDLTAFPQPAQISAPE